MQQYQCLLVANECYQRGRFMTPTKIVVHSTAANNTSISRYVQPAPGQTAGLMQYQPQERKLTAAETKAVIGENRYGNDWNRGGLYVCVHAFLGRLADGSLAVCQTLPWKMRCWGVGSGRKGSYNDCAIPFEICEDDHRDAAYCRDTFELAAELCAHLMRAYPTITEIVSHNEAGQRGYGSDHNDPDNWWPRHGYTMGMLRRRVAELLAGKPQPAPEPSAKEIYRIRKSRGVQRSQQRHCGLPDGLQRIRSRRKGSVFRRNDGRARQQSAAAEAVHSRIPARLRRPGKRRAQPAQGTGHAVCQHPRDAGRQQVQLLRIPHGRVAVRRVRSGRDGVRQARVSGEAVRR